jgi:hypothetical protein
VPEARTTHLFVGAGPCQPYSGFRSGGPDAAHHSNYGATFGFEGSIIKVNEEVLPHWSISEQVIGFGRINSETGVTHREEFVKRMMGIKRPDGSDHFAAHICVQLDSNIFVEGSRPRSQPQDLVLFANHSSELLLISSSFLGHPW